MKKFLPIGSVVMLNGGSKRVMICGRVQNDVDTGKLYDYSACLYPEGFLGADSMYLFNAEDIAQVYYLGLQDEEEFKIREYINSELEKMENTP